MEIVDYQAVLADLKARRTRLDSLIAGIEADIMGQAEGLGVADPAPGGPSSSLTPTIHPDSFFGLSIIEAAKKYLKMARRAQHTSAIADALSKGGMKRPEENSLSSILIRAAKGREVSKVGRGMWGLAEWYPKPPKDNGEGARKAPTSKRASAKKRQSEASKQAATKNRAAAKNVASKTVAAQMNGAGGVSGLILEVLRAAEKPLHVRAITEQVNARGRTVTRSTIEGLLSQWVKKDKVKRTAPGTFAL